MAACNSACVALRHVAWTRTTAACLVLSLACIGTATMAHAGINKWTNTGPGNGGARSFAIDPTTPTTLYAGAASGIFKSTDGGTSWNRLNVGVLAITLAIDPLNPTTLYAWTANGLLKSIDAGASWNPTGSGLPQPADVAALVIDLLTPATLYAGTYGGTFKSVDGGATWSLVPAGN